MRNMERMVETIHSRNRSSLRDFGRVVPFAISLPLVGMTRRIPCLHIRRRQAVQCCGCRATGAVCGFGQFGDISHRNYCQIHFIIVNLSDYLKKCKV
jgi:hypothetical protein